MKVGLQINMFSDLKKRPRERHTLKNCQIQKKKKITVVRVARECFLGLGFEEWVEFRLAEEKKVIVLGWTGMMDGCKEAELWGTGVVQTAKYSW